MSIAVRGVSYGPFRDGQDPSLGAFPAFSEVKADLVLLDDFASALWFYSSDATTGFQRFVAEAAKSKYGFDVAATAFLNDPDTSFGPTVNQREIDGLVGLINDPNVDLLYASIGVESILRGHFSAAEIITKIDQVRAATPGSTTPIMTAEPWHIWLNEPALAQAVDVIGVNIYAFHEGVSINSAAAYTLQRFNQVKAAYPGKMVVIVEAGWPSAGSATGAAVPSTANAERFYRELLDLADQNNIDLFAFSAFDENWKLPFGSEQPHFGLYDADRGAKYGFLSIISPDATDGADFLSGTNQDDHISGLGGNDVLEGKQGADLLDGGDGTDAVSHAGASARVTADLQNPSANTGDAAGDSYVGIENLIGTAFNDSLRGDNSANHLQGGAGNDSFFGRGGDDILDGGIGADKMRGYAGNDTMFVDNAGDVVIEVAGEGAKDRVAARVSYILPAGADIELFTTTSAGGSAAINLTGNRLAQTILGNAGKNIISDGAGAGDMLRGLGGNDVYVVRSAATKIIEKAGEGTNDRVAASVDFTLAADVHVETLTTTAAGATSGIDLTGNALAQKIVGNAGNNILRSGKGAPDTLEGRGGNDTYRVYNTGDAVIEAAGGGNDRVITSVDYTLGAGDSIELFATNGSTGKSNIDLTGNTLPQTIYGNAGKNIISDGGGSGADVLAGLGRNDTYIVRNNGTTIVEKAGQGAKDRVAASFDFALAAGVHVEMLTTTSAGATSGIDLAGNALAQTIVGNAGNNILRSGKGAADTMEGRGGNDIYRVYNTRDAIIEAAGGGNDRVITTVDYSLGAGDSIELFTTNGSAGTSNIDLTGNEQAQRIFGNSGDNRIDGGLGADDMNALGGNDTFIFSTALGGGNVDKIIGFNVAADQIEIDNAIFAAVVQASGAMLPGYFKANAAGVATDGNDRIVYDTTSGELFYDADGNGAGAAQQFADLAGGLALSFDDFEVI